MKLRPPWYTIVALLLLAACTSGPLAHGQSITYDALGYFDAKGVNCAPIGIGDVFLRADGCLSHEPEETDPESIVVFPGEEAVFTAPLSIIEGRSRTEVDSSTFQIFIAALEHFKVDMR